MDARLDPARFAGLSSIPIYGWNRLLHSSLAQRGQYEAILFPDSPFPTARVELATGVSVGSEVNDLVPFLP
jgi:hypothetical protein